MAIKNLIGVQFGQSVVEEYIGRENDQTKWLARCSCGNTYETTAGYIRQSLRRNSKSTCPECRDYNFVDLTDTVIGQVTVLSVASKINGRVRWNVRCSCGREYTAQYGNLAEAIKNGDDLTCKPCAVEKRKASYQLYTVEYNTWQKMKQRCLNPARPDYPRYGGKGITVCERWMNSYENFLADMGERPGDDYSIDRIDPTGNYEPSNCRWLPNIEQSANRSTNIQITYNGKTQILKYWCNELELNYNTVSSRYKRGERDPERLLR